MSACARWPQTFSIRRTREQNLPILPAVKASVSRCDGFPLRVGPLCKVAQPADEPEDCMIDLYYWTTPNGHKITMFLEEAGIPYALHGINIGKGDQFKPAF